MYLALIPDAQTFAALRTFAPALAPNAHCTIIHSKAQLPADLRLPKWREYPFDIRAASAGLDTFGGLRKVRVLKFQRNARLDHLREEAKQLLLDQQPSILASATWSFNPHVTLGGADAQLVGDSPALLRFDRMEWRP